MHTGARVLVTGGAGFIGSHLADALLLRCYRVRVIDALTKQVHCESPSFPPYLSREMAMMRGDVRNRDDVLRAIEGVEAVFHFAAAVGVGQSIYEIESYTDNNTPGT